MRMKKSEMFVYKTYLCLFATLDYVFRLLGWRACFTLGRNKGSLSGQEWDGKKYVFFLHVVLLVVRMCHRLS